MAFSFKIIDKNAVETIIPFIKKLTKNTHTDAVLKSRFKEMVEQNYECAGIYSGCHIIGICGMWFQTRHYAGKSVEIDHLYINAEHQGKGLGTLFLKWVNNYAKTKGCLTSELNTYVENFPSHKFYYNEGYQIRGYHFLKTL